MKTLEAQLQESGLEVVGRCDRLSDLGAPLLQASAMLRTKRERDGQILPVAGWSPHNARWLGC